MPLVYDLEVRRDETRQWQGRALRRLGHEVTYIDLTTCDLNLTVRTRKGGDAVFALSIGDGVEPDPDQDLNRGVYVLTVGSGLVTGDLFPEDEPRTYPYDLVLVDEDGPVAIATGALKYSPDVT